MKDNVINRIKKTFENEFSIIEDKFNVIELNAEESRKREDKEIWKPGVYVFWSGNDVIKIGRSFENSRKRSLEHIQDNTSNNEVEMKDIFNLGNNSGLILFNVKDEKDFHWVASLEIYLEKKLDPVISSGRIG